MGKKIILWVICIQMVLTCCAVCAADADAVRMEINDGTVVREIGPEMYGVNMEWNVGETPNCYMDEEGNIVVRESFPKAYGNLLQFTRKAGGSANLFLWKESLGDFNSRGNQSLWGTTGKITEGMAEWLETLYAGCEHPRVAYVVNLVNDTYENLADVVEFLTGDGTVNYNGGINWAEERIKLGFEEPVDIYTWEIGNELDWRNPPWTAEEYLEAAEKAIDIIKSIDPDGKIALFAATDYWAGGDGSQRWHRLFLEKLGDRIDYVSLHYYYPPGWIRRADANFEKLEKDILEITGSDRIKIYYSEQAPAPVTSNWNEAKTPYDYVVPHTIWGATGQSEWYLRKWLDPWVVASTCHSVDSAAWSISYTDENNETQLTATGEIMKSFNQYGVGDMLDFKLDGYSADTDSHIAGGAVRDAAGNLNVFFLNRNEEQHVTVNFDFDEYNYKIKHIRQVYGDSKYADTWYRAGSTWASYNNPDKIKIVDEAYTADTDLTSYTFAPLSLCVLQLEQTTPIDPSQKKSKDVFPDIADYTWAKEAINGLYEKNIVSGTGNGLFEPERDVSREEFVKMLVLAKGYSLSEETSAFSDVDNDEWYAPYVNIAYSNAIVSGVNEAQFGIGQKITRQDAAALIWRSEGNPVAEVGSSFADESEIADYAVPAIAWMQKNEYISGYEDGTFQPQKSITRAEAAKILFQLVN